jgi:predicted membrane channel-forming protein YqfA (hemolysin III family)
MVYTSLTKINNKYYICRKEKYINIAVIFLLGVIPMILDNGLYRNNIYINYCILSYIIGGIIWVYEIPERYIRIPYFDSVGWMHICVIIGDIFLINSIAYIR